MKKPGDKQGRTYAQFFIEALVNRAIAKSDVLIKEVLDRVEGRVGRSDEESQREHGVKVTVVPRMAGADFPRVTPVFWMLYSDNKRGT